MSDETDNWVPFKDGVSVAERLESLALNPLPPGISFYARRL